MFDESLIQSAPEGGLKRRRSSVLDEDSRPSKILKQSSEDSKQGIVLPDDEYFEEKEAGSSVQIDGLTIRNLALARLDEKGDIVPLILESPSEEPAGYLPTPETDDEKEDPMLKAGVPTGSPGNGLPQDFIITGDIKLFGFINSKIYLYQGMLTRAHPYVEIVKPAATKISLGSLIPHFKDSPVDAVALENTQLCYSEVSFHITEPAGLYFETDVVFQGALQPISDLLKDFFHQEKPALHVSTYLGRYRNWQRPATPTDLVLRGSLDHVSVNVFDIIQFTRIGVELSFSKRFAYASKKSSVQLGYGFFGELNLTVPGSIVPMQVEYYLRKCESSYLLALRLQDPEWTDVLGIKGLNLSQVEFTAFLTNLSRDAQLSLSVTASLSLGNSAFAITGTYSKEECSLEAYVGHLTLQDIGAIFTQLTGSTLDVFDHDVVFDSLYLKISTSGLVLSGAITINGYTSARGTIAISRDGIYLSGGIGHVEFDHFTINDAQLDVFVGSSNEKTCARTTKFCITGDLSFCDINLKVGIYTSKSAAGDFNWTIYGVASGDLKTSHLSKDLEGTFLDITLKGLAFIASNEDSPSGDYNVFKYPITKGVQFCASIDSVPELEQIMRGSVKGMVLRAGYTAGRFNLGIIIPGERTISFGDTVYTGPLELEIQTGTDIKLVLKAILNVGVETQPEPLRFALGLKAGTIGASAYANMLNEWVNPCGVGKNVKIRGCALEFGIVYSTFFTTGTPGEIGLAGQLNIGEKEAKMAMKLSQNPKEQLLAASVKDLGVVDLVKFASAIAEYEFPEPDDFLHFNDVDLYISTGTTIGIVEYPAGASLKGDMTIFGKRAKFNCTVGSLIKIMATIEHFELGPLKVRGATGPDPIVDIELSSSKQSVLIDGAIEIWGASAAVHLQADVYPKPAFDFWVNMRLSDLFIFQLRAKLSGDINFKDFKTLANADFEVYALLEQHLIEHIVGQLEQQIESAKQASKQGFDMIKKDMEEKEAAFQAGCQKAIDELEAARAVWHAKRDAVHAVFESAKAEATQKRIELQAKVDEAERGWKNLVADATRSLEQTRAEATAAINEAQSDLDHAQRDSDDAIREAQDDLHRLRDDFNRSFGSAVEDLESAEHDVNNAQRRVDELDEDIRRIDRQIDDEPWYKCPPLIVEKGALCTAQGVAIGALGVVQGVLYAAEGIVRGTGFVAAEGAIGAAELALDGVREVKGAALEVAKSVLQEANEVQQGLINEAIDVLHAAERASEELHVFDIAKAGLEAGEAVAQGLISGAQTSMDALAECGEFLAFDVSEKALEFAKNNTKELNLARHAVELAEGAVNLGLDMGSWLVTHGGSLINITKVEFSGSIKSLIADGPPLKVTIKGILFGNDISIHIVWQPHFNLVEFIKALFNELWEMIKDACKLFHESK